MAYTGDKVYRIRDNGEIEEYTLSAVYINLGFSGPQEGDRAIRLGLSRVTPEGQLTFEEVSFLAAAETIWDSREEAEKFIKMKAFADKAEGLVKNIADAVMDNISEEDLAEISNMLKDIIDGDTKPDTDFLSYLDKTYDDDDAQEYFDYNGDDEEEDE